MKRGKKICNALRDVRRQIALANDIPYETTDCHHEGECQGTCPKCEAEVRYIENQLSLRRAAGKAVSLVGLSLGISAAFAANAPQVPTTQCDTVVSSQEIEEGTPLMGSIVERRANFPGGEAALMKFIWKNMKYPISAARDSIEGRVTLSFNIEKDGAITDIEVVNSPDERLSEEAVRIVKMMPKWNPEWQGKPVRVKYVLPITFRWNSTQCRTQLMKEQLMKKTEMKLDLMKYMYPQNKSKSKK